MRLFSCSPTYASQFQGYGMPPATLYMNSKNVAAVLLFNGSHAQFNYDRIDAPQQFDFLQVTDTVATINSAIADFDTGVSFPATIVTLNGAIPSNTAVSLKSQNIIYMWAAPSSNSNVLYWDENLQLIQTYVLSGTPSSLATAINAIAGGDSLGYPNVYTNTEGIVAHAGGGQQTTGASLLTTEINVIGTVATALDSVTIGAAAVSGQKMTIVNTTSNIAMIYPFTSGTFNGGTANAGIHILPGQVINIEATSATNWEVQKNVYLAATGITASTTQTQAGGTALTAQWNEISTVANASDTVTLAPCYLGSFQIVKNSGAHILKVYAPSGADIDGGSANGFVLIPPGTEVTFEGQSATVVETKEGITGAITQITTISTGVELDTIKGIITTVSATTAGLGVSTFTLTNNKITTTSNIRVYLVDYAGTIETNGIPLIVAQTRGAGSIVINIANLHATNALSGILNIGFEILP